MKPEPGMRVLDVGGQPYVWDSVPTPLDITCLNLPGIAVTEHDTHHKIRYVDGNGCQMPEHVRGDFDLVFSNSVIEHVGDGSNRAQFASEIQRISPRFWVQTPNKHYPFEAHTGMPFWWYYPQSVRDYFIRGWSRKLPAWTEMVSGTTYVPRNELTSLFPGATIEDEWLGLPKSYIVYSRG
ncbi:MAG: class I SAM-dependent methyltransferase [Pseudomonadota bacterium]